MSEIKILEEKSKSKRKPIMTDTLQEVIDDVRCPSGFLECMQCATCTASCPAARIYEFNPREMMRELYEGNLEELLKGDHIWECGQCYTCQSRCPRGNNPGQVIMILRHLSCMRGYGLEKIPFATVLIWSLYNRGYGFAPDLIWDGFIDEFGEGAVEMWKNMKEIRKELGYLPDDARQVPISGEAIKELQIILDETLMKTFNDRCETEGVSMEEFVKELGPFDYFKPAWKNERGDK